MTDLSEFVTLNHATLTTDSKRVAKHFGKSHKNVLRAYDNLMCSAEFNRLNFEPVEDLDEKGESRRVILMTKDGFAFLAMGFTGQVAAQVKEAYIKAFNSMQAQLQQIGMGLWEQRLMLEKRDDQSFALASLGSRFMLSRKKELPHIKSEREQLVAQIEPGLFPAMELH